jgi:hypothetical protein
LGATLGRCKYGSAAGVPALAKAPPLVNVADKSIIFVGHCHDMFTGRFQRGKNRIAHLAVSRVPDVGEVVQCFGDDIPRA